MRRARQLHWYLGTFFAPAILFFTFTGALQTFGLHEAKKSFVSHPPAWIGALAEIHKDQRLKSADPPPIPSSATAPVQEAPKSSSEGKLISANRSASTVCLKIFVLTMSIGLFSTTCLGLFMAFRYNKSKTLVWILLGSGTAIPLILLFLA
jgi:hypothetical protein